MGGGKHTERGRRGRPPLRHALPFLLMAFGVLAGAALLCARPGTEPYGSAAPHAPEHVSCLSPSGPPGCSQLSHVTPGVLPGPPQAAAVVAGGGPAPAVRPAPAAGIRPPPALARGPDLYALQVLRT
ncbi:hypothetical protein [Streptomyces sp. H34-S4]|uniref:hypothetical protein n=1 Tax=Streptomyces sp. H34-S4 TaxID=2996463 RepID=UPI00226DDFEB|nr:hypothetical protein [Streptomyces sp. H34-S4]MCY0937308.1 hypothetical protein [Streptomyces sp. H34-S4]